MVGMLEIGVVCSGSCLLDRMPAVCVSRVAEEP